MHKWAQKVYWKSLYLPFNFAMNFILLLNNNVLKNTIKSRIIVLLYYALMFLFGYFWIIWKDFSFCEYIIACNLERDLKSSGIQCNMNCFETVTYIVRIHFNVTTYIFYHNSSLVRNVFFFILIRTQKCKLILVEIVSKIIVAFLNIR